MQKLNVRALALTIGVITSASMLLLGWMSAFTNYGAGIVAVISNLYIGFGPTVLGGIIGAIWGFIDGAIGGALIAWLYNYFGKKR